MLTIKKEIVLLTDVVINYNYRQDVENLSIIRHRICINNKNKKYKCNKYYLFPVLCYSTSS